ncbi:hypothetical protein CIT292_07456 [Citrobacter youngae ATCC 29220]|uniref:Uncharacterized protein n=1 Tax=Citrobacter youngae ATCC 29220 TaxID=500640 RepID=D4BAG2_9ENTR|nr:hypothetical protein CIT292_07456 [Citrobacter youngae ATCC 29220]
MPRHPVNLAKQQFPLALQQPQCVFTVVPARALIGRQQLLTQLPGAADNKHHTAARTKGRKSAIGNSDFRLANISSGHDIKIHRHLPFRQLCFDYLITSKGKRLMPLQGVSESVRLFQSDFSAFQQGNNAFYAGEERKLSVRCKGRDTRPPVKIARCWRETANFTRFSRAIAPQIDRHFADIKVFHHPSRTAQRGNLP